MALKGNSIIGFRKPINLQQKLAAILIVLMAACSIAWLSPKQEKLNPKTQQYFSEKNKIYQSTFLYDSLLPPMLKPMPAAIPEPPLPPAPPKKNGIIDSMPIPFINNNIGFKIDTTILQRIAKHMQAYFSSGAWKKQQQDIEEQAKEIERYFNSKEWKNRQQNIQKVASTMKQYFESPEWKDQQKNIEKHSKEIEKYFNSEEWKKQQKHIAEAANKTNEYFNSEEWKQQQKAIEEKTRTIQDYFNSAEWKKQQEQH